MKRGDMEGGDMEEDATGTISRLAVVDRGETAVRVLNAVHGLAHDGGDPIATVLVHPGPDRHPWYGREADESVPVATDATVDELVAVLRRTNADASKEGRSSMPGGSAAWISGIAA